MNENTNKKAVSLAQLIEAHTKSNAQVKALRELVDDLTAAGGEPNVITGVKVNGEDVEVTDKSVDITVPTKMSELSNDSGYMKGNDVSVAIKRAVAQTSQSSFKKVNELPSAADAEDNVLYLLMNEETGHYDIYAKVYEDDPARDNFAATYGIEIEEGGSKQVKFHFNGFVLAFKVYNTSTMADAAGQLNNGGMFKASGYTADYDERSKQLTVLDENGEPVEFTVTDKDNDEEVYTPKTFEAEILRLDDTTVDLSAYDTAEEVDTKLGGKVDKVDGKGLSSNDYTDEDKAKLDNKVDKEDGKGLSEANFTAAEKEKLAGIEFATDEEVAAALAEIYGEDTDDGGDAE